MTRKSRLPVPAQVADSIERAIYIVRGTRVMLDEDLARLYGVTTSALNQAVARNVRRFPADFAFRLTPAEASGLKSQFVTSSGHGHGGRRRAAPRAFTEQGVAMLSSVLRSERAIAANVLIMRTFVQLRRAQGQYAELRERIEELAREVGSHRELLAGILSALDALERPTPGEPRPFGFRPDR